MGLVSMTTSQSGDWAESIIVLVQYTLYILLLAVGVHALAMMMMMELSGCQELNLEQ